MPWSHRAQKFAEACVSRPLFWAVFVALGIGIPMVRSMTTPLPKPLPVLSTLPEFQFTNQYGQPYGSKQLSGKVWIANFIFTRCPTICPVFTQKMGELQHRVRNLGPSIHLVSFSVDPEHDTPPVLLGYAQSHKASPRMWTFLTGQPEQIRSTVVDGLKISMGREGPADDLMSIFHGTHFVLVDRESRIRGYYASDDKDAVETLLRDAGMLVNRGY
jgi:protein SCO1/2